MAALDIVIITSGPDAIYDVGANCLDGGEAACGGGSHGVVAAEDRIRFKGVQARSIQNCIVDGRSRKNCIFGLMGVVDRVL